jgi:hypothetical protein
MSKRADVRKIDAPVDKVWAGLLLFEDDEHPIVSAVGNPGEVGSRITYRHGKGEQIHDVLESGNRHFLRYRCHFRGVSGFVQHLAFTDATVEADYEIKPAEDGEVTYIRAVADYQPPIWPTAIALLFALLGVVGMNSTWGNNGWIMGILVSFWIGVGIAMQYLPRVFAYRFVTGPVLARLQRQAESGSFTSSIAWRQPDEEVSLTGSLENQVTSK